MFKHLLPAVLLISSIISCGDAPVKQAITVDNPTSQRITFSIDTQRITLDSAQSLRVLLDTGSHSLKYHDSTFNFTLQVKYKETKFLLNPTRSGYILEQSSYFTKPPSAMQQAVLAVNSRDSTKNRIKFDSVRVMNLFTLHGNYKSTHDLFIAGNWDYNITEKAPTSLEARYGVDEKQLVKIYRERDFLFSMMKQP